MNEIRRATAVQSINYYLLDISRNIVTLVCIFARFPTIIPMIDIIVRKAYIFFFIKELYPTAYFQNENGLSFTMMFLDTHFYTVLLRDKRQHMSPSPAICMLLIYC